MMAVFAPSTSGSYNASRLNSAATTNATVVKAGGAELYGWSLYNANAAVRYVKLYDKATAPTVGTDTPVIVLPVPPGAAIAALGEQGIGFTRGLTFATTTGAADSDTAAVAANEIIVNLFYR